MYGKMMMIEEEPIDTTGWFDNPNLESTVTETLKYIFKDEPPIMSFQFQYTQTVDPATISVGLPLCSKESYMVEFRCSLEEIVDEVISYFQHFDTGKVSDDEGREVCSKIATRLRELANKLERAMK